MFGQKKQKTIKEKAEEANEVLLSLGIEPHTESGKQIRAALAMEILGQSFDLMDMHGKATFVKQHGEVIQQVRDLLIDEGVLTRKPAAQIEHQGTTVKDTKGKKE